MGGGAYWVAGCVWEAGKQAVLRAWPCAIGSSTFLVPDPVLSTYSSHFPCCISSVSPLSLFYIIGCLLNVWYILNKIINPYSRSCHFPTHTSSTLTVSGKAGGCLLLTPMILYQRVIWGCKSVFGCYTSRLEVLGSEYPACVALNQWWMGVGG